MVLDIGNIARLVKKYNIISKDEPAFFKKALELIFNTYPNIPTIKKGNRRSFYWPKLNTEKDGFINWDWSAQDTVSFCHAFDQPFGGAFTFYNEKKVRFKNVTLDDEDIYFHPYQYGIIYRIDKNSIWVAAKNGGIKIKNLIKPQTLSIRIGKRFCTNVLFLNNTYRQVLLGTLLLLFFFLGRHLQ